MDCHLCKYRREIIGDCHSGCDHQNANVLATARLIALAQTSREDILSIKSVNAEFGDLVVEVKRYGVAQMWCLWPLNFDPTWVVSCSGFERKGEVNDSKPA